MPARAITMSKAMSSARYRAERFTLRRKAARRSVVSHTGNPSSSKNVVVPMPGSLLGVGIEKQMTVTVTCDHRIISGADAAVFLKDFAAAVENPATLTK